MHCGEIWKSEYILSVAQFISTNVEVKQPIMCQRWTVGHGDATDSEH